MESGAWPAKRVYRTERHNTLLQYCSRALHCDRGETFTMTQQLTTTTTPTVGVLARWRTRWLGERDSVETQLADIARQGARMAHVAHVCASALLILFSAASFVALGGDTFAEIQARWSASRDILAQAELASGAGVIRDVVREAQDQGAPLAHKIALYGASAVMRPDDRERLHAMLGVVQVQTPAAGVIITPEDPPRPPEPPAGRRPRALKQGSRKSAGRVPELAPPERRLRALLEAEPSLSVRALAKRAHTSQATASKHRRIWRAEAPPDAAAAQ